MRKVNGVTITTHFPKSDKDMFGDYYDVIVDAYLDDDEYHIGYGDHYHDKGLDKAAGFVDALRLLYGQKLPVLNIRVADRDE